MKQITSIVLASLIVICLLGLSPASTPVLAQESSTHFYYLPQVGRQLPLNMNINKLSLGWDHACAITPAGRVKCWGWNPYGSLGDGTNLYRTGVVDVTGLNARVTALDAGPYHACVLTEQGGVKCWGNNDSGQLGDGTQITRFSPVDVVGLTSGVKAISTGDNHTCALTDKGAVLCWGYNSYGEVGDGTTESHFTLVSVVGLTSGVRAVSAGTHHTCVITEAGGVKCWGTNEYGEIGSTTPGLLPTPVDVAGLTSGVLAIATGAQQTCVITSSNTVKCWGYDWKLWEGKGWMPFNPTITEVPGLTDVVAISAGAFGDCALTATGGAKCWGDNTFGELGDGTQFRRTSPVNVLGLTSGVSAVVYSESHACALLINGSAQCWGLNGNYQLGIGTKTPNFSTRPLTVVGFP